MFDVPPPPTVPPSAPVEYIQELERPSELTAECVKRVSRHYRVHPLILSLVIKVEGGWSGAKIGNTNHSYDLGLTQINSIHLPELRKYGLTEAMVRNNNCINLGVSAWYIRTVTQNQTAAGTRDYFRAIARYHSKNEPHITRYTDRLMETYEQMIEDYRNGGKS
ncbi:MAG: lytic transglycosylase, catalytic [Marinobacter sp. T13-3]|nr:MAG: lytic transglycosylase, catalytic [Marinobacter sp. T13-3]